MKKQGPENNRNRKNFRRTSAVQQLRERMNKWDI
jgi:hypothetical protein